MFAFGTLRAQYFLGNVDTVNVCTLQKFTESRSQNVIIALDVACFITGMYSFFIASEQD